MSKKGDKIYPIGYPPPHDTLEDSDTRNDLLKIILGDHSKEKVENLNTDIFEVMTKRRSDRKFDSKNIEEWKVEKILAAADTAPTAGNFQGFENYFRIFDRDSDRII